ncbi:MAG: hypothetical protein JRJ68_03215, partial [Deltaproteobacteria bacterium]|nr:hypothetical protein [Deltaproteobacteria bacterium]
MTFLEFKDTVDENMPVDALRKGRSLQKYKDQALRAGVINVQRLIKYYRLGHETLYIPSDLGMEGNAHKGNLPVGADLMEAWILEEDIRDDHQVSRKIPLRFLDWVDRDAIIYGDKRRFPDKSDINNGSSPFLYDEPIIPHPKKAAYIAVSPKATEFYISPRIDGHALPVVSMTYAAGVVTVDTGIEHGLESHDVVEILDTVQPEYIGEHIITRVSPTVFTYPLSTSPVTPATGTPTWRRVTTETSLLLVWDGVKLNFQDSDSTPFDEELAQVVALYV